MLSHLMAILADFSILPNKILPVAARYTLALMLVDKKHEARQAAALTGCHESQFSRLLNRPDALKLSKACLNRAARRRLAVIDKMIRQGKPPLRLCRKRTATNLSPTTSGAGQAQRLWTSDSDLLGNEAKEKWPVIAKIFDFQ